MRATLLTLALLGSLASAHTDHSMWRIKMKPGAAVAASRLHFDTEHMLESMSRADANRLQAHPDVLDVSEHKPAHKHSINLGSLDQGDILRLHALHHPNQNTPEGKSTDVARLVSRGRTTSVWQCAGCWTRCVEHVSSLPDVYYVEPVQPSQWKLRNAWSSGVTQSGQVNNTPFWDSGITGRDQIVGCADTGIDMDSCLYWDPDTRIFDFNTLNPENRKIIKYITTFGDARDGRHGHGSHVTGSIAGKADPLQTHGTAGVSNFNGMAPEAKLVFTDVDKGGSGGLNIPDTLDGSNGQEGLFPVPYEDGAKIHSNSWGSSSAAYTLYAQQIDSFVYDHPDFLVLVANGNDGEKGTFSVGSPATCKNCLGVGAGQNAHQAYEYSQSVVELAVDLPTACDLGGTSGTNLTFEAIPASFGTRVDFTSHAGMITAVPGDGCAPLEGSGYDGRFVIVERGTCTFAQKAYHAQLANASVLIVTQNSDSPPFSMGDSPGARKEEIHLKAVMISRAAGRTLRARSDQCTLKQHHGQESEHHHWQTLDASPPPQLPSGFWSGVQLGGTDGLAGASCVSAECLEQQCTGWIETPCGGTVKNFSMSLSGEGLLGYAIDISIESFDGESFADEPRVSLGLGRWKDDLLDLALVSPECAVEDWCTNRLERPTGYASDPTRDIVHWHLMLQEDQEPVTNATAFLNGSTAFMEATRSNPVLFEGLNASLKKAHSDTFNSTNLAGFTSRGPTLDGRLKPDVCAPGHTIFSTFSDGMPYTHQCGLELGASNSTITTMSGTSMATPITAGSAALVRQYFEDGWLTYAHGSSSVSALSAPLSGDKDLRGFNPSSALVRAVLINSADDMDGFVQVASGGGMYRIPAAPSFYQGFGRVHLSNTLCLRSHSVECSLFVLDAAWLNGRFHSDITMEGGATHRANNTRKLAVSVPSGATMRATLVWTDPPGNPAAAHPLVNDLDLTVTRVGGTEAPVVGNGQLYNNDYPDQFNIQEQVVIQNLESTATSFEVLVEMVPNMMSSHNAGIYANQSFSVVISADRAGMTVQDDVTSGSDSTCPQACNGNGNCQAGICRCDKGYIGAACALPACPSNCSDHAGSCVEETGRCNCGRQRFGAGCEWGMCMGTKTISLTSPDQVSGKIQAASMPPRGDITGMGIDASYGDDLDCQWELEVPEGYYARLEFDFMNSEKNYDFMKVFDSDNETLLHNLTGNNQQIPVVTSTGNTIIMRFTSDGEANTQGFSAQFSATKCRGGCLNGGTCNEDTGKCQCRPNCVDDDARLQSLDGWASTDTCADNQGYCLDSYWGGDMNVACPSTCQVCTPDENFFGPSCQHNPSDLAPCNSSSAVNTTECSGHGLCGNEGVCDCFGGWTSSERGVGRTTPQQCGQPLQCNTTYNIIQHTGTVSVNHAHSFSDWSGECRWNFRMGNQSMLTTLVIPLARMSPGDTFVVSYGTPTHTIQLQYPGVPSSNNFPAVFEIPTGLFDVSYHTVDPEIDWAVVFGWQSHPSPGVGPSPVVPHPSRTRADGHVRLVGALQYAQVASPGAVRSEFISRFESDVEAFEASHGRSDTVCTVTALRNGSVMVDFTLHDFSLNGSATDGLQQMQTAVSDGSLTRLAGVRVDRDTSISATPAPTLALTASPTQGPSQSPTAEPSLHPTSCPTCPICTPSPSPTNTGVATEQTTSTFDITVSGILSNSEVDAMNAAICTFLRNHADASVEWTCTTVIGRRVAYTTTSVAVYPVTSAASVTNLVVTNTAATSTGISSSTSNAIGRVVVVNTITAITTSDATPDVTPCEAQESLPTTAVALGAFAGIAGLLFVGFVVYGVRYLASQARTADGDVVDVRPAGVDKHNPYGQIAVQKEDQEPLEHATL